MQDPTQPIWKNTQERLSAMLNPETFNLWFAPISENRVESETLYLNIPNDFFEEWLAKNYLGLIRDVVAQVADRPLQVSFVVNGDIALPVTGSGTVSSRKKSAVRGASRSANGAPQPKPSGDLVFNPNNTFDTFVVGENNSHAHAAAMAVANSPGKSYNPVYFYGGVGLGKTHLLHAIGHEIFKRKPDAKVAYVSSERFTNEYIDAIRTNSTAKFRKKYREQDALLIDDVQFLVGKERIQEEFFHTFNALHETHRQIVLTCDRQANELEGLEHRIISRFEWGLVADIKPPDVETRLAILRKKARNLEIQPPDEVLSFLANRIRTNIRRLEGALIRVASHATLTGKSLTLDLVEDTLSELLLQEGQPKISIDAIQRKVAEIFDIRLADMTSRRRPENIAFPRQIAMYLARQLTDLSLSSVGDAFGGRDHGTVLHACRLVKDRMEIDKTVQQKVQQIERQLLR